MGAAIEIHEVSKRFRLYHEKYSSLKEKVLHAGHIPFDEFWALRDVQAEITAGETIGILGRNGSGKSTLLKCIAGILQPTSGEVVVRGQVAAMLELGAGFQPELSGRDNIYLNGSLLGLSRRDIAKRFDAIVEFAELEQFIDNQVKYYSSGMYVRLGFAVAVNVEPDVLLVDEVLAVGDERFQEKCLDRVHEFQREGRTIVVVSHSPDMLRKICDEIFVVDQGELIAVAPPGEAIRIFRDRLIEGSPPPIDEVLTVASMDVSYSPAHKVEITSVEIEHPGFGERPYLVTGEPLTITVAFKAAESITDASFGLTILSQKSDVVYATSCDATASGGVLDAGAGRIVFRFDSVPLLDGRFTVNIDARDGRGTVVEQKEAACTFEVMNPTRATGLISLTMHAEVVESGGIVSSLTGR